MPDRFVQLSRDEVRFLESLIHFYVGSAFFRPEHDAVVTRLLNDLKAAEAGWRGAPWELLPEPDPDPDPSSEARA